MLREFFRKHDIIAYQETHGDLADIKPTMRPWAADYLYVFSPVVTRNGGRDIVIIKRAVLQQNKTEARHSVRGRILRIKVASKQGQLIM